MKAINEINKLCKQYPLFTLENDIICEVRHWIKNAFSSLIPNCYLELASDYVNVYEIKPEGEKNPSIIKTLREIIQNAYSELLI